jgi:hypothetical protein
MATPATDTTGMTRTLFPVAAAVLGGMLFWTGAEAARAGGHAHGCRATAGGMPTPCGDSGCGPKYWGAKHDEPWRPDPCDACVRWRGCNGGRPGQELLAPWQLPPGRGFTSARQVGWEPMPCVDCANGCPECCSRHPACW